MRCFIVTPPGFETETIRELHEVWPELLDAGARPHSLPRPAIEKIRGGLEFETDPVAAVQLNFFLKTASRVLLRLAEFRVRDFPRLHEKLRKLDVRAWTGDRPLRFEVSAQGSRLNHEGRIRETAASVFGESADAEAAAIYIRISDDLCTVSLDTTGEHLHRRGVNTHRGAAPLRETLAAFLLRRVIGDAAPADLRRVRLIDPFCGSGTFLTEAATRWDGSFARPYAFQNLGRLPKLFRAPGFEKNYRRFDKPTFGTLGGRDLDSEVIRAARENARAFPIDFRVEDALSGPAGESGAWIVCNPPYGLRLRAPPAREIYEALQKRFRPARLGILWPLATARGLRDLKPAEQIPVSNGGLDCLFSIWISD